MNPRLVGVLGRAPALVDIRGHRAGHAGHDGPVDFAGAALHGSEVIRARRWKACFDDVHTESGELVGEFDLLYRAQREAWRLLAIAQGRVEDLDVPSNPLPRTWS